MLCGTVYVLPGKAWTRSISGQIRLYVARQVFRWRLVQTIDRMNRRGLTSSRYNVEDDLRWAQSRGLQFAKINACILRTGEARFWLESDLSESASTPVVVEEEASKRTLAQVAYFFIKDITHLHTHHHHSQDGMLPFRQIDENVEGEREWQRQSMWALSRSIEEYVRRSSRDDLRAALGTIPYAENFYSLYAGMFRVPGSFISLNRLPITNWNIILLSHCGRWWP